MVRKVYNFIDMIIFPLVFFILSAFLAVSFVPADSKYGAPLLEFIPSVVISVGVCLLYVLFRNMIPLEYSSVSVYLHYLFHDNLFYYFFGMITVFSFATFKTDAGSREIVSRSYAILTSFCIFAIIARVYYGVHSVWADPYMILVFPGILFFHAASLSLLTGLILKAGIAVKIAAAAGMAVIPFITALISAYYYLYDMWFMLLIFFILYGVLIAGCVLALILRNKAGRSVEKISE